MRGKVFRGICNNLFNRITPAYAGKSRLTAQALQAEQDHPRLCGEKIAAAVLNLTVTGSPPPMRGKVFLPRGAGLVIRITPAYAGKSRPYIFITSASRDHPRLCGEKFVSVLSKTGLSGSPPPMRGKVLGASVHSLRQGITPAYAGKSLCRPLLP